MKRVKKALSVLLAMLLFISAFPALTAYADGYNLSVADYNVTVRNAYDVLGDGTVRYDSDTNTLTLTNASFKGFNGIHFDYPESGADMLTVVLIGTNTISTYSMEEASGITAAYGIRTASFANGPGIVFKGSGTLNIEPGFIENTAYGIAVSGDICFEDSVTVNVNIPTDIDGADGWGIYTEHGAIRISGNARVTSCAPDKALYSNEEIAYGDGYVPLIKAGSSSRIITLTMVNPAQNTYIGGDVAYQYISIRKAPKNTMKVTGKTVKAYAKKKTSIARSKAIIVKNAKGKVTYAKVSGNSKISVTKSGRIIVKKGLKKGKTYKVKIAVTAAGTSTYQPITKKVTVKIKIK